jgi:hypothetical protein
MPVSYEFRRADDGRVADLAEVERLVRQAAVDGCVDDAFDIEVVVALGIVATFGGGWDEARFRQAVERYGCVERVARRFLAGELVFHSWR